MSDKEVLPMRSRPIHLVLTALAALGLILLFAAPAHAANWSALRVESDCQGHGCLAIWYRVDLSDPENGYYLETVKITAKKHDATLYDHIDGKGLSCWNDRNVVKWSKDGTQTNLYPSATNDASRTWDTEVALLDSHSLTCSWFFTEVYSNGGAGINNCVKIKLVRGQSPVDGFCG
jgi:hypothetical protein